MRNLGIGTALGFGLLTVPAMAQDQFLPGPGSTSQTIIVTGVRDGYQVDATSTATRTPTELNDVPQAVSIITETQIDDQAMRSIADVLRSHDCHPRRWPSLLLRWPRDQRSH